MFIILNLVFWNMHCISRFIFVLSPPYQNFRINIYYFLREYLFRSYFQILTYFIFFYANSWLISFPLSIVYLLSTTIALNHNCPLFMYHCGCITNIAYAIVFTHVITRQRFLSNIYRMDACLTWLSNGEENWNALL